MRVLVADDHSLFRDGIVSLLEASGFEVVGQVGDGRAAVEAARSLEPDLVLMDIAMPHLNGLEAMRRIKANSPETRVVMLTVSEDDANLMAAARAGADGYLLKSLNAEDFLDLIEGLDRGEAPMTLATAARLLQNLEEKAPVEAAPESRLTDRELEVLRLVAGGLPNKTIAQRLSVSENTIKYHMKNILQKLDAQSRTQAAMQAISKGLLDPPRG